MVLLDFVGEARDCMRGGRVMLIIFMRIWDAQMDVNQS